MFVAVDGSPVAQHAIEHDRRLFHGGRKRPRLDSAESATRLLVCVMEATGSAAGTLILTLQGEFGTQSYSGGKSIKFKTVPPNPDYTFSAFGRISRRCFHERRLLGIVNRTEKVGRFKSWNGVPLRKLPLVEPRQLRMLGEIGSVISAQSRDRWTSRSISPKEAYHG